MLPREEAKAKYGRSLVERFGHMPEVRRISKHQHVPKAVLAAKRKKEIMKKAEQRKEANRRRHGQPDQKAPVSARAKRVWKVHD